MSVVVAIKGKDRIYLGADSQVTKGGTRVTLRNPNNYKIWKVRGAEHCLMAHVGLVRDANVVRIINDLVDELTVLHDGVDYDFVVSQVVPHIIHQLRSYEYLPDPNGAAFDGMESSFLFAYEDKLFSIARDGCVIEVDDSIAIGSGSCEAIGSIISTDKDEPAERIVKAIKASAASDIYVDYPIILTDTGTTEFTVITEKSEAKFLRKEK